MEPRDIVPVNDSFGIEDVDQWSFIGQLTTSAMLLVIMTSAVLGNALVIVGVARFYKLRSVANSFLVSLAFADLLVALFVMPFSASQEIAGRWLFGQAFCDVFNANDVLFSTASLLHICCISVDRYIYITNPFHYTRVISPRRAGVMIAAVWVASAGLSHIPIHLSWHMIVAQDDENAMRTSPDKLCLFKVNPVYGIMSSAVSFWLPATVMLATYVRLYREAIRQERFISESCPSPCHQTTCTVEVKRARKEYKSATVGVHHREGRHAVKKNHKAARTLGVIVGAFLLCWLPFFTWYLATTLCSDACHTPRVVSSLLFWIGYLNSAINPVIYAFFNHDFREAFCRLLRCCCHLGRDVINSETLLLRSDVIELNGLNGHPRTPML